MKKKAWQKDLFQELFVLFFIGCRHSSDTLTILQHKLGLGEQWTDEVNHDTGLVTVRDFKNVSSLAEVRDGCLEFI